MGNVFNRYGAGGGKSEGLYLWKKSEIIPPITVINPSFTFDSTGVSKTLNLSNFDFTQIDNYIDFFDGFTDGGNAYFYVTDSVLYYHTGSANHSILTFNATNSSTATMTGGSFTSTKVLHFDGAKILQQAKVGNFIGYVISDKEDAYPDKEAKDGFYYEKMALSPETFGCTKFETGSFTMASDEWLKSITHSMGVKPLYAIAWTTATTGATRIINSFPTSGAGNAIFTWNNNANHVNYSGQTSDTTSATISTRSGTYYTMKSGSTYHYILMA